MMRKFLSGSNEILGPRTVRVLASTGAVDRTGEIVVPGGIDISGFLRNPVILWQHDPEHPIGSASNIAKTTGGLQMDIEFAPEGVSKKADEICGLVKAGILSGVSIGFDPVEVEPMVAGNPRGPQRYVCIDLMETSIVSIPANIEAAVVQRRFVPNVRREGRRISADTEAIMCQAIEHLEDAIANHAASAAELNQAGDILAQLLADQTEKAARAVPRTRDERMAEVEKLRPRGNFPRYPEHMRGESIYHYAARATLDFKKSRGIV
jgi:HK97 family phage prohead protease